MKIYHGIVQPVECETLTLRVVGSNPTLGNGFLLCRGLDWMALSVPPNSTILWFRDFSLCVFLDFCFFGKLVDQPSNRGPCFLNTALMCSEGTIPACQNHHGKEVYWCGEEVHLWVRVLLKNEAVGWIRDSTPLPITTVFRHLTHVLW